MDFTVNWTTDDQSTDPTGPRGRRVRRRSCRHHPGPAGQHDNRRLPSGRRRRPYGADRRRAYVGHARRNCWCAARGGLNPQNDIAGDDLPDAALDLFNAIGAARGDDPGVATKDNGAIGFAMGAGSLVSLTGGGFGTDGAASSGSVTYALSVTNGTPSGLSTTEGTQIFLYNGTGTLAGLILGRVGTEAGATDTANPLERHRCACADGRCQRHGLRRAVFVTQSRPGREQFCGLRQPDLDQLERRGEDHGHQYRRRPRRGDVRAGQCRRPVQVPGRRSDDHRRSRRSELDQHRPGERYPNLRLRHR